MKTLEAFWRWVDNEKPGTFTIIQKACGSKALSPLARTALDAAADVVWEMHQTSPVGYSIRNALDFHRDDLRDVSIALLPALEKVVERRRLSSLALALADVPALQLKCGVPVVVTGFVSQKPACVVWCTSCNAVYSSHCATCPSCHRLTTLNVVVTEAAQ